MSLLGKLSDKVLSAVIPAKEAVAVCPPDCIRYTESDSSGWCRTRQCCYRGSNCDWYCSAWTSC